MNTSPNIAELSRRANWGQVAPLSPPASVQVIEIDQPEYLKDEALQKFIIEASEADAAPDAEALLDWIFNASLSDTHFVWVSLDGDVPVCLLIVAYDERNPWAPATILYIYNSPKASDEARAIIGQPLPEWCEQRGVTEMAVTTQEEIPVEVYLEVARRCGFGPEWHERKIGSVYHWEKE